MERVYSCSYVADESTIRRIAYLDSLVYAEEYQGDYEGILERHLANPDSLTLLLDRDEVVGYLCAFPVVDSLYKDIRSGEVLIDSSITPDRIRGYSTEGVYDLYLISVVLHPDYQGSSALKYLLRGFIQKLNSIESTGIDLGKLLSVAVSEKGNKLMRSFGLEELSVTEKGSIILEGDVTEMVYREKARLGTDFYSHSMN